MTPQPVSTLGDPGGVRIPPRDVPNDLYALLGKIIAMYSLIDARHTLFMAACSGMEPLTVAKMLGEIDKHRLARQKIVEAWITIRFQDRPEDRGIVEKVLARIASAKKIRDPLAHGVVMSLNNHPSVLAMVDHGGYVEHGAAWAAIRQSGSIVSNDGRKLILLEGSGGADVIEAWAAIGRRGTYYSRSEIEGHVNDLRDVARLVGFALQLISGNPSTEREARDQLSSLLSTGQIAHSSSRTSPSIASRS